MITQNYITFFKGLEKNNNKEWFHEYKETYEKDVKRPFLKLLEALIAELFKLEPAISPDPKEALFRINKDVRFMKDKTPYHTLLKAGFAPGGKKSCLPGYYMGISAEKIHVGGGLFNVQTADIKAYRSLIAENTDEFIEIVHSDSFVSTFKELKGEHAKRLDKGFKPLLSKTPYIANKQFYAMRELPLVDYLDSDKILSVVMDTFKEIHPLNQFLKRVHP